MGCWNATCFISNLPIRAGEPCVGFLIAATGKIGIACYPDDRYRPITPPIEGVYDDYGGLELSSEKDTGVLYQALRGIDWLRNKELEHPIAADSMMASSNVATVLAAKPVSSLSRCTVPIS